MANFTFGNEDEDNLDLDTGADEGIITPPAATPPVSPFKSANPVSTQDILNKLGRPGLNRPEAQPVTPLITPVRPTPTNTPAVPVRPPSSPVAPQPVSVAPPVFTPATPEASPEEFWEEETAESRELIHTEQPQPTPYSPPLNSTLLAPVARPRTLEEDLPVFSPQQTLEEEPVKLSVLQKLVGKNTNQKKANKRGNFAGERRKILIIRIVVVVVLGVLVINGVKNIVAPATGPTRDQVIAAAQEAVGFTDFPVSEGQGLALGFTTAFLNYSPTPEDRESRAQRLLNYAPETVVNSIEPAFGTKILEGSEGEEVQVSQTITDGPYLVGSRSIDDTNAVFTTVSEVNNTTWLYLDIPVRFDAELNALAVSASPSFVPATGVLKVTEADMSPQWVADTVAAGDFEADLTNYLTAWAASESDVIGRYITPEPSLAAKTGLGGVVEFSRLNSLTIESLDDTDPNVNTRRAEVSVTWKDAISNVSYPQSYRLVINYNETESKWSVDEIQNSSLISGENTQ
jgi:Conjugative transposon protein TcpC